MKKSLYVFLALVLVIISLILPVSAEHNKVYSGYLCGVTLDMDYDTGEYIPALVILDDKGVEKRYPCASTVVINGTNCTDDDSIKDAITGETYASFTLDTNGCIDTLDYSDEFPANRQINTTIYNAIYSNGEINLDLNYNYVLSDGIVGFAIYDTENRLVDIAVDYVEDGLVFTPSLSGNKSYIGYTAKLLFWDGLDTMRPISDVPQTTIVSEVSLIPYGYVADVAFTKNQETEQYDATIFMVTPAGINSFSVSDGARWQKSDGTRTYIDLSTDEQQAEFKEFLANTVISYQTNVDKKISVITEAGYTSSFEKKYISSGTSTFDADNLRFTGSSTVYIDSNSAVFFIDPYNINNSYVGMVEDIADNTNCTLLDIYYDSKADDNNIVVIDSSTIVSGTTPTPSVVPDGLAVITSVSSAQNSDGEEIYFVEVLRNGDTLLAETVALTDLSGTISGTLTEGDIVMLHINDAELIDTINTIYDFAYGVRTYSDTDIADNALNYTPYNNPAGSVEIFAGGQVASYVKNSTLAQLPTTIDGANSSAIYKISQADNVYVIDPTGRRLDITKGSSSSFKYYEDLYTADSDSITVTLADRTVFSDISVSDALALTDYVFVRAYDNKVRDVVIVKGCQIRSVDW